MIIKCRRCKSPNTFRNDFHEKCYDFSQFKRDFGVGYECNDCGTKFLLNCYITGDNISDKKFNKILENEDRKYWITRVRISK